MNKQKYPLNLNWKKYPAGADILLFNDTMCINVSRYPNRLGNIKWCAVLSISMRAGGGALFIADKISNRESAIIKAEQWLKGHLYELIDGIK
jgi:hypothetical protein